MTKLQKVCPCCEKESPQGCPLPAEEAGPAPCPVDECECIGIEVDGGLCLGCYLWTK